MRMYDEPMAEIVDGDTLVFTRRVPHPPERVWRAISDADEVSAWMGYRIEVDARVGGRVRFFDDIDGVVFVCDPPRALAYSWVDLTTEGGREAMEADWHVRWDLEPDGDGTRITFTHRGLAGPQLWGLGAGWHSFLDELLAYFLGELDELLETWERQGGGEHRDVKVVGPAPALEPLTRYREHASTALLSYARGATERARAAVEQSQPHIVRLALDDVERAAEQLHAIAKQWGVKEAGMGDPEPTVASS